VIYPAIIYYRLSITYNQLMTWCKKIPWLSLIIFLVTYGVLGWIYSSWGLEAIKQRVIFGNLETELAFRLFSGWGIIVVLLIALLLSDPISLITISLGSWLQSDIKAFLSIFLGAFAFTLIFQWFSYLIKFLVLVAAALLLRLDLQQAGVNKWLSILIMAVSSLLGFTGGILAFYMWGLE
jgi:uncharacterized protein YacL